jgi:hypothetical protein
MRNHGGPPFIHSIISKNRQPNCQGLKYCYALQFSVLNYLDLGNSKKFNGIKKTDNLQ